MTMRDWMMMSESGKGKPALKSDSALNPEARAALVQKTFEAITMCGFLKFRDEERKLGFRLTETERKEYFEFFEQSFRTEFETIVARGSDAQVQEALQSWTKEAKSMGLAEWQREQAGTVREM